MSVDIRTYSVKEACEEMNIPESSFRLAIRRGEVEVIRVTGHGGIRIRRSALEKWLAMKERESRALVLAG